MIDPETRLEQIEPGAGLEQVFRFRLVGKDAQDVDAASASERLRERARAGICGQATLAPLVARGVRVTYVYLDRAGAEALRFFGRPDELPVDQDAPRSRRLTPTARRGRRSVSSQPLIIR